MVGVENECQKYGYKVFLQTIGKPDDRTVRELHQAVRVDGLIFVGADVYPSIVRQAKQYGIPAVLIDNWMPEMAVDAVVTDNRGGVMRLVNYLVSQGHKRIGFIGGPLSHRSLQERYDGYRAALRKTASPASTNGAGSTPNPAPRWIRVGKGWKHCWPGVCP